MKSYKMRGTIILALALGATIINATSCTPAQLPLAADDFVHQQNASLSSLSLPFRLGSSEDPFNQQNCVRGARCADICNDHTPAGTITCNYVCNNNPQTPTCPDSATHFRLERRLCAIGANCAEVCGKGGITGYLACWYKCAGDAARPMCPQAGSIGRVDGGGIALKF